VTEGLAASAMLRFPAFFPGLEAPPGSATPQALHASSPSRGAKELLRASSTRKGMATHTQLKLWFAAHLAGEPRNCFAPAPPARGWRLTRS